MSFDFPNSPAEGATYSPAGGPQYIFQNGVWKQVTGGQSPVLTAQTRNRIVNGAMQISQENGNTAGTTDIYYPADQWVASRFSSSTISYTRNGPVAGERPYNISITPSTFETAAAATEYVQLYTKIEGNRLYDFAFGYSTSKQTVIAFDVVASIAGTYWVSLLNGPATHVYLAAYTISAAEVLTWTRKTVVIPAGAINAGTWPVDTAMGAWLRFCVHAGANFTGVAGLQAGTFQAGPGQALGLSVGHFSLANVGLYLDPDRTGVAPQWQMPDEAEELRACQRYWEKGQCGINGHCSVGAIVSHTVWPAVHKRVNPAISLTPGTVTNLGAASTFVYDTRSFKIYRSMTAVGTWNMDDTWVASARM